MLVDCFVEADQARHELTHFELVQASAPLHLLHFTAQMADGRVDKKIYLEGNKLMASWNCRFVGQHSGRYITQINLAMPSCDGFAGRYVLADGTIPGGFGQHFVLDNLRHLQLEDEILGGTLVLNMSKAVRLDAAPYHTVSLSEAGFEKIMQGVCLNLSWTVDGPPCELILSVEIIPRR
jgi:alpha-amylase